LQLNRRLRERGAHFWSTIYLQSTLAVVSVDSFATPTIIERAGSSTRKKFFEFFTVPIRNANTRAAYYRAIQRPEASAFWKASLAAKAAITSGCVETRIPRLTPGTSNRVSVMAMVFIRVIRFVVGRAPDDRTEVFVPPVLRFSFRRKRHPFFNLPYPVQTLHNLRDPRCPSRNLLLPRFSLLPLGDTIENEYEKTNSLSRCDIRLTSSCHL
jgi:hypothetical protein